MNIGEFVFQYRKEHGLSMQAFGDLCGLSRAYISILEKGINPTTGKAFIPTIETLKKIAESTNSNLDSLLAMLDGSQSVILNSLIPIEVTPTEKEHIKKYRQLDADGKEEIDDIIDVKLAKLQRKAEAEEANCG
ncbi:MAG: helix-turn-helix transcriptional regulator [Phascolarctobacterium sp.]|uniref:helix-turn-helix domain-containing protein n=1 Tax=Phascolarctobacterium sp. TaxID=2049039 RepID=UPI0026DD76AC|nr:helix-turn-helix transcriptional regulator [Phascolarctobacterium sp.]MDO4920963.1 helix-turn-helix transcriptional regulator [Phascolarctobacterium sp.]